MTDTVPCPCCGRPIDADAPVTLDLEAGIVVANGQFAYLSQQQMAVFAAIWDAFPRMLTREALFNATAPVIGWDDRELKIVDVFICHVRRKLRPLGIEIETMWGKGYRAVRPREAA